MGSRCSSKVESQTNLAKTSALIDKFNNQSKLSKQQSRSSISPARIMQGSVLTAKKLSKNSNPSFDSSENLSLALKKSEELPLQSGAFSCSSSSNRTPPLNLKEQHHNSMQQLHSSSNSVLDLRQKQQQQQHLQHKNLDKLTSYAAKRAQFKNTHQNENLTNINAHRRGHNAESLRDTQKSQNRNSSRSYHHTFASHLTNTSTSQHAQLMTRNRRERSDAFKHSKSKSLECANDDETINQNGDDVDDDFLDSRPIEFSPEIIEAADKVTYITNHIKSENDYEEVRKRFGRKYPYFLYFTKWILFPFCLCNTIGWCDRVGKAISTPKVSGSNSREAQKFSKTNLNISRPHYLKCASNIKMN